jgi:hypothetical protein
VSVCTDGKISDAETDVDCGGGCPPCGMGKACDDYEDCESMACQNGLCQMPTCDDHVKNGAEADKDCGGQCSPCPAGGDCRGNEDCVDGVCANQFCQVPTCNDAVKNGGETGPDCGGSCAPAQLCELGAGCVQNSDCESGHCAAEVCVSPACTDGNKTGNETDVDCGGNECGPCAASQHCAVGGDCMSEICEGGLCTSYSCDDHVQNGEETEQDCGGSSCKGCGNLQHCEAGRDCASGACQSDRCVPSQPTGKALSRMGWSAKASDTYPDDKPNEVLDSSGGRWTSGTPQYDGMWFEVDMGTLQTFFKVVLKCEEAPLDVPQKFDLYLSQDGKYGAPARPGQFGKPLSEVAFDTAQVARYVKFVLRQSSTKWLSIDEIQVYE